MVGTYNYPSIGEQEILTLLTPEQYRNRINGNAPILVVLTQTPSFQPLSWMEDGIACSATYNLDGTVATLTKGSITRTYTYSSGILSGVA